jgi:hypothetical protein
MRRPAIALVFVSILLALLAAGRFASAQQGAIGGGLLSLTEAQENASPATRALAAEVAREKLAAEMEKLRLAAKLEDRANPLFRSTAQAQAGFVEPARNLTVVVDRLQPQGGGAVLVEATAAAPMSGTTRTDVAGYRTQAGFTAQATVKVTAVVKLSVSLLEGKVVAKPAVTRLEGDISQLVLRDDIGNQFAGILVERVLNEWIAANHEVFEGAVNRTIEQAVADGRLQVSLQDALGIAAKAK